MACLISLKGLMLVWVRGSWTTIVGGIGVWFTRVFYMTWAIPTGGAGIKRDLTGPFDLFVSFASFMVPLAALELYLRAERSRSALGHYGAAAMLGFSTLIVLGGSAGAWMAMWAPYL